ncbi:MAG: hypothetical protein Q9194_001982 [Teloschistes cf. exilis]
MKDRMMAQIQVRTVQKRKSKQAIAPTKVAQELDIQQEQRQSFEIVHTILHSSLAHLVYLRHLFPENCFIDRSFDEVRNEAHERYRNHIDDASPRKKRRRHAETDSPAVSPKDLKALRQDSAPEVNTFLGWLDGILEGVSKGNINAAQFSICPDPADRAKVIESYTFRFHYGEKDNQSDQAVAAITVSGIARVATSICGVKASLMDLMKLIATYTDCMPDLPVFAIPISIYDVTDTFLKKFPKDTPAIIASSKVTMIND